jgi:glucose/arabinose dehydrogenase
MARFRPACCLAVFALACFAFESPAQLKKPGIRGVSSCPGGGDNEGLPLGFRKVLITPPLEQPIAIVFADDGRLFIGERLGHIRLMSDGVLHPEPVLTFPNFNHYAEQGLHGMALDPNFASNGWIYVRYTTAEPRNRLSRFQIIGDVADPDSELVLWEAPRLASMWHHGGAVEFGPDGKLYTSTGDAVDPPTSQDPSLTLGKILRLEPDGATPADNPFLDRPEFDPRIWALGLRSPFRLTHDRPSGRMWIGDVGSFGPSAREEVNLCVPGANYGWPNQEGDGCYVENCADYMTPVFAYARTDPVYSADGQSASIILGPVYRSDVYPAEFAGSMFFADYANRWIRRLILNPDGSAVRDEPFMFAPHAGSIVDMRVGPDGLLYFVVIGYAEGETAGVYRIEFDPNFDRPPVAVASASPLVGDLPLHIQFSSAGSFDPDGDPAAMTFCWDFGDGESSSDADPEHSYTRPGLFEARLTVYSGENSDAAEPISIAATHLPLGKIITPDSATRYRAGEVIRFSGAGYDEEDGWLDAAAYSWEVHLIHASHTHPLVGPLTGVKSGEFTVAADGHGPENTHYAIQLTLTDSQGLSSTVETEIFPETTLLSFASDPPGVPILLDHEPTATPRDYLSVVGFHHQLEARETVEINGQAFVFRQWSNGQPRVQTFEAPQGGAALVAVYGAVESGGGVATDPPTASDRLVLCPLIGSILVVFCAAGCIATRARSDTHRNHRER